MLPKSTSQKVETLWRQLWLCIGQLKRELQESPEELCWSRLPSPPPPFRLFGAETAQDKTEPIQAAKNSAVAPQQSQNILCPENITDSPSLDGISANILRPPRLERIPPKIDNEAQKPQNKDTPKNISQNIPKDMDWWEAVENCQSCGLGHEATRIRQQAIPGYPRSAHQRAVQVLLVCDAPSYDADQQGQPLSKENLDYLLKWLGAIDLEDSYYLTNFVKCRTPGGRAAWPEEIQNCAQHLHAQLRFFEPKAILALGGSAARSLSGLREDLESLRQRDLFYEFHSARIRLFVTYAVSEVLHHPKELRAPVWADLKRLRAFLQASVSAN